MGRPYNGNLLCATLHVNHYIIYSVELLNHIKGNLWGIIQ